MKYIVVLGDGMADYPIAELGNKTPLEAAKKPNIDALAKKGTVGMIQTVPKGMKPGSDVANLSAMGYSPLKYYSGRSPLEALSIGAEMGDTDIALRVNTVTLSDDEPFSEKIMVDYSAGEIPTDDSKEIIEFIEEKLGNDFLRFYPGVSYRHCLINKKGNLDTDFTPPHDISDRKIGKYLPKGGQGEMYLDLIKKSYELLLDHPVNLRRRAAGKRPVSAVWFWGAGTKPMLDPFEEKYGLKGGVISAVDLLKGIAVGAKMKSYDVAGATGNIDTNFQGKAEAALNALLKDGLDYLYLHIEAPDECGHRGEAENKTLAIEKIDGVVKYIYDGLLKSGEDFVMAVLPDHATPVSLKTHTIDPVPFVVYKSNNPGNSGLAYTERDAQNGIYLPEGEALLRLMLSKTSY